MTWESATTGQLWAAVMVTLSENKVGKRFEPMDSSMQPTESINPDALHHSTVRVQSNTCKGGNCGISSYSSAQSLSRFFFTSPRQSLTNPQASHLSLVQACASEQASHPTEPIVFPHTNTSCQNSATHILYQPELVWRQSQTSREDGASPLFCSV